MNGFFTKLLQMNNMLTILNPNTSKYTIPDALRSFSAARLKHLIRMDISSRQLKIGKLHAYHVIKV